MIFAIATNDMIGRPSFFYPNVVGDLIHWSICYTVPLTGRLLRLVVQSIRRQTSTWARESSSASTRTSRFSPGPTGPMLRFKVTACPLPGKGGTVAGTSPRGQAFFRDGATDTTFFFAGHVNSGAPALVCLRLCRFPVRCRWLLWDWLPWLPSVGGRAAKTPS
jgi:hypothetical protein